MADKSDSNGTARPLRFGVMCRGTTFAAWEALCIRNLLAVPGVEPALLIVDDREPERPARSERLRGLFDPMTLLWRLYQRLVLNRASHAADPVDLSAQLAGVPIVRCRPNQSGKFVQRFRPEEIAEIRRHDLDFVLRFGFNILRGEVLDSARHGVWSFHHGDPDTYRGQPPGFWEIYRRDPVVGTVLQRLTERLDAGVMLHRGWFKAEPASYPRTRDAILFGAADWPARLCRELQAGFATPLDDEPSSSEAPIYYAPNSFHMLRFAWIWLTAKLTGLIQTFFRFQQWSVAVIDAPVDQMAGLSGPRSTADWVRSARWIPEPKDHFLADPFAVPDGEGLTILAEDFDWITDRGHIASVRAAADGSFGPAEPVIKLPWHLSYPYLLELDGSLYCIPEMNEAGKVALFRASADRREWTEVATLFEGAPIVDPTIFRHDGRWWLLASREDEGANLKLYGWHAAELTGPWTPHLANPLKTDVRSSRPAGPLFEHDGALYRPAQDCSTVYGAAVVVHRVTVLTPERFEEQRVSVIAPDRSGRYPLGLHTLSGAGGCTVIDGSRRAFVPVATARAFRQKLARLTRR